MLACHGMKITDLQIGLAIQAAPLTFFGPKANAFSHLERIVVSLQRLELHLYPRRAGSREAWEQQLRRLGAIINKATSLARACR